MTTNNRQRKSSDHGNNPTGLAHGNAFLISGNSDVGLDYRSRKSSGQEKGVIEKLVWHRLPLASTV